MNRFEMEIHNTNFRSGGMALAHFNFDWAFERPYRSIDTGRFITHVAFAACVLCVGFALQCRFCWAIFLGNSGDELCDLDDERGVLASRNKMVGPFWGSHEQRYKFIARTSFLNELILSMLWQ